MHKRDNALFLNTFLGIFILKTIWISFYHFDIKEWLASNFYENIIPEWNVKVKRKERKGNNHHCKGSLIFKQILSVSTFGNEQRTICRIWLFWLMFGCKGLKHCLEKRKKKNLYHALHRNCCLVVMFNPLQQCQVPVIQSDTTSWFCNFFKIIIICYNYTL